MRALYFLLADMHGRFSIGFSLKYERMAEQDELAHEAFVPHTDDEVHQPPSID